PDAEIRLLRLEQVLTLAEAFMVRGIAFTQMARAFAWSVGDLMRMRLTTALGLQRLIAEGFGLLCLMRDDPAVALAWGSVVTDEEGIAFYRKHQGALKRELDRAGLGTICENASAHGRLQSR